VADRVPYLELDVIDRYMLAKYATVALGILQGYDEYDYGTIFQTLNAFLNVDLSALYIDVSKDCLYTFGARSRERRSVQTAMYIIADGLTRLMAPILSFTADEIWRYLPGAREESVHVAVFPAQAELEGFIDAGLIEEWVILLEAREMVNAALEKRRQEKLIGPPLQARVVIGTDDPQYVAVLRRYWDHLPMLFIVSEVVEDPAHPLRGEATAPGKSGTFFVSIERASGTKCERCWRYVGKISNDPAWAGLCERCQDALAET
jgi:isoleucyl-tRNA synthetase